MIFNNETKFKGKGFTYDDVLLLPLKSDVLPAEVSLRTKLAGDIYLNIPVISAAMDKVTEHRMAIAVAKAGGIGIIHKNMSAEMQAKEISIVKSATIEDIFKNAAVDKSGRLIVGAAVGATADVLERVKALSDAGIDVIVVDSAHGHNKNVLNTVRRVKDAFPHIPIIGGNIATGEGAHDLIHAGADAIKVGMGPGSICTTRVVAGIGVPQITAIFEAASCAHEHRIPVIADGGLKYSGDIPKAIAAGANAVMLGSLLAGCDESPGETEIIDGEEVKIYRGMGSMGAMEVGGRERYFQEEGKKLVPEGIEGHLRLKGPVADTIFQLMGGLRAGMGYCGCANFKDMWAKAKFIEITFAGFIEGHPHDITIAKDAPNYSKT